MIVPTDVSLAYKGFDLWERLRAFNDSFTVWHLESVSLLSAMIRSIEGNSRDLFSVRQSQVGPENDLKHIEIANPFEEPSMPSSGKII